MTPPDLLPPEIEAILRRTERKLQPILSKSFEQAIKQSPATDDRERLRHALACISELAAIAAAKHVLLLETMTGTDRATAWQSGMLDLQQRTQATLVAMSGQVLGAGETVQ